jgi:hypothetical protein
MSLSPVAAYLASPASCLIGWSPAFSRSSLFFRWGRFDYQSFQHRYPLFQIIPFLAQHGQFLLFFCYNSFGRRRGPINGRLVPIFAPAPKPRPKKPNGALDEEGRQ